MFPERVADGGHIHRKESFAATATPKFITKRYTTLEKINSAPAVIETLPKKTKELKEAIFSIFSDNKKIALKNKEVRAGKGKLRGRKYKSNAGALIVTSTKEDAKFKGFDMKNTQEISISDLYPLGRLTLYTKKALEELGGGKK